MRSATVAAAAIIMTLASPPAAQARAPDPDPWFGRDKALHFAATFGLAAGGYAGCAALSDERWLPWVCGGALAMGAGLAKEGLDLAGYGDPSWRDLTWDAIGTASGLLVAFAVDRLILRRDSAGPKAAASASRPAPRAGPPVADVLVQQRVRELLQLRRALEPVLGSP